MKNETDIVIQTSLDQVEKATHVAGQTLTSLDQVEQATIQDLRRTLLTTDGAGVKIKTRVLDTLLLRAMDQAGEMMLKSSLRVR